MKDVYVRYLSLYLRNSDRKIHAWFSTCQTLPWRYRVHERAGVTTHTPKHTQKAVTCNWKKIVISSGLIFLKPGKLVLWYSYWYSSVENEINPRPTLMMFQYIIPVSNPITKCYRITPSVPIRFQCNSFPYNKSERWSVTFNLSFTNIYPNLFFIVKEVRFG